MTDEQETLKSEEKDVPEAQYPNAEVRSDNRVDLGNRVVGPIDLPNKVLNLKPYIGVKVKIAETTEHMKQFKDKKTGIMKDSYYVKITSEIVDTIEKQDGTGNIELTASKILGLQQDKDGNLGWGKDTRMDEFLKSMGVAHYKELKGKEVVVQTTPPKEGKVYLTFN